MRVYAPGHGKIASTLSSEQHKQHKQHKQTIDNNTKAAASIIAAAAWLQVIIIDVIVNTDVLCAHHSLDWLGCCLRLEVLAASVLWSEWGVPIHQND
jgi:hypothetical protein